MGKYMRKPKITGDVAVMEVLSQSSVGVRTRAKTHALQRLQSTSPEPSYLQLRNRRLEKVIPSLNESKKQQSARKDGSGRNPNPSGGESPRSRLSPRPVGSGSVGSVSINCSKSEQGVNCEFAKRESKEGETEDYNELGFEASFGEHNFEFEGRERSTRESTPCSLIRGSDTAGTPGSTTRRKVNRRIQNARQRNIPTTFEMEEFFALAERHQQKLFMDKYNFDVVNDLPLPGRYEWVRINL
ncbi:cyclin-dependent kinase inhibitor 3-like [Actinidia eriantha]|uniref:cyclin-dependent kinase inhibitor 3-like n=1 Tax=Actinidia eriantha TaxID=165200 RepID=UPI0025835E9D|nr:cyclin-dependent kinase inhibitor 3-like [Actinidia eriantha]